jgi:hypothetical protein
MDKIFNSAFDFFSYAIPGCYMIFAFFILDCRYNSAEDYILMAGKLQVGSGIMILVIGYIVGFAISPMGRYLYKSLGFKLFKNKFDNVEGLSISDKYVLLRELSPNNFKYVEIWNVWCTMSHNLAIASGLIVIFSFLKIIFLETKNISFWLVFATSFVILFFLFVYRAVTFSVWAAGDINSSIKKLHIQARADKLSETREKSTL